MKSLDSAAEKPSEEARKSVLRGAQHQIRLFYGYFCVGMRRE
jgi:hypothetical protein